MKAHSSKSKISNLKSNAGFSILEILVACSIILFSTFAILSLAQKSLLFSRLALNQTQATFLLEEGAEAVKSIRDVNWSNISDGTYYPVFIAETKLWSLSGTPATDTGKFTRSVLISSVSRDSSTDDIVTSGGTPDPGTKKVTVTVTWPHTTTTVTRSLSFYIANLFD